MVTDKMRARLDDIPAVLVAVALRLAPADQREFLRVDWVDNLLVAFDEKNARYPVSRIVRSLWFVLPLFGTAMGLRRQARAVRRRAAKDEKLERLVRYRRSAGRLVDLVVISSDEQAYIANMHRVAALHNVKVHFSADDPQVRRILGGPDWN